MCCLGISTSSSCWILSVNAMIKTGLLFSLRLFLLLCFLFELFTEWGDQRVGVYWILQHGFSGCGQWIVAPFGLLQRNSSVGVLENALPLGNNTTTHNSLSPPTHLCTFWSVISGNRNLLSPAFFGGNKQKNGSVW